MPEKIITIRCTQCSTEYQVHEPEVLRVNGPAISEVVLFAIRGIEERACPKCRAMHGPVLGKLDVQWIHFQRKSNAAPPEAPKEIDLKTN